MLPKEMNMFFVVVLVIMALYNLFDQNYWMYTLDCLVALLNYDLYLRKKKYEDRQE